jgi:hypothetical protein
VYSATSLSTAVNTPLPKGCRLEDRIILFMSFLPDEESLCVYILDDEQIKNETEKIAIAEEKRRLKKEERAKAELESTDEEDEDVEELD